MTIAQPFMAGYRVRQMKKSREGRQKNSFVPGGTLDDGGHRVPAMNGWAIFRGSGATPKTATGTGALPGKVPAVRPMVVLGWTNEAKHLAFSICVLVGTNP
jgi:hypothetical protein